MHYVQQLDETDCGAACLAMVASHYGRRLSIAEVRNVAGTDVIGTNIPGILIAYLKVRRVKMDLRSFITGFFIGIVCVAFVVIIIHNAKKIKDNK